MNYSAIHVYHCNSCGRIWADGPASRELGVASDGLCRDCRDDLKPAAEGRASQ